MNTSTNIVDRYAREVSILAARLSRRWRLDRDDVRQELALVLLIDGNKYNPNRGSIWLWLSWKWRNLHRQRRTFRIILNDMLDSYCRKNINPATLVADIDEFGAVLKAIDTLPTRDRDALRLSYGLDGLDGKTLNEIAQLEGVSPQWVSRRRLAGIARLREMFAGK
jgi:RNA polymerase sigma factor (sigma-70 family)